jgi:adenylosuccinate synthase
MLPDTGEKIVVQTIPAPAFVTKSTLSIIGAAGMILPEVFEREIRQAYEIRGNVPCRVHLDRNVAVIDHSHMRKEAHLKGNIGSTGEGVGAATADKVMRNPATILDHQYAKLFDSWSGDPAFMGVHMDYDTPRTLNIALREGKDVIIEGTQGVLLSLHTSGYYPFCTSRECTPQGMLAQTGIAQENAKQVEKIMVVRTYPIRVGGNSGDLPHEITWATLKKESGGYVKEAEITTVTKKKRRIARIDYAALQRTVMMTRPTALALTFFDYWFPEIATITDPAALKDEHWAKINDVEHMLGVPVKYLSTGFGTVIPLRVTL